MTGLDLFWTWVAAFLTLCIYSFLYKDNPLYKIAEHLVVGVSAAYFVVIVYFDYFNPNVIEPLSKAVTLEEPANFVTLIPVVLGVLMLLRISKTYNWLSRFSIAFYMGIASGLSIAPTIETRLIRQAKATMFDFTKMTWVEGMFSFIILVGVLSTLVFFFFSKEHKGVLGGTARVGIVFLMVGFGASFGYTVMARVSLLIGRINFLVNDWVRGTIEFISQ